MILIVFTKFFSEFILYITCAIIIILYIQIKKYNNKNKPKKIDELNQNYFKDVIDWKFIDFLIYKFTQYEDLGHGLAIGVGINSPKNITPDLSTCIDNLHEHTYLLFNTNFEYKKPIYCKFVNYWDRNNDITYKVHKGDIEMYKKYGLVYIISIYDSKNLVYNSALILEYKNIISDKCIDISEVKRDISYRRLDLSIVQLENLMVLPDYKKFKYK